MTCTCAHIDDLKSVSEKLFGTFPGKRIFAVQGSMGAGKTTFIRYLCQQLGVQEIVQSPSFAIINEYSLPGGEPVFHFDFYRIRKREEIFDLGYEEYLYSGAYCFIEWPEIMEDLLPSGTVPVTIGVHPETGERRISF